MRRSFSPLRKLYRQEGLKIADKLSPKAIFLTCQFCFFLVFSAVYTAMSAAIVPSENSSEDLSRDARSLEFDYEVFIKDIPLKAREVKVWLPYLAQTPYQKIESFTTEPKPEGLVQVTSDKVYHNKILHYSIKSPGGSLQINVHYKVTRYEYSNIPSDAHPQVPAVSPEDLMEYLAADRLVTISPRVQSLAKVMTQGKETTLEKARAIYDYVFENVRYDKTIPGWGNGDTERVCLVKAGNCTDFHSLFISLARSVGIPAKFVIGTSIPREPRGEIKGYHCWAEFYDEHLGWVPVDISEAWKDASQKQYYFGTIPEDRIEFSQGRDIVLEPPSHTAPLNYFFYPYVEVDGKIFNNLEVSFKFKDA